MDSIASLKFLITSLYIISFYSCKNDIKHVIPSSEPTSQEVRENYGNGQTSRLYTRVNGKIEGKMTDFYPSGALKGEKNFVTDKQDGKTTIYYESGSIKEVQYYTAGLRNSGDTIFYEDGSLQYICEFKDNIKNGYLRKWGEDGILIYEAKFAMDTLIEVGGKPVKQEIKAQ